MRMTSSMRNASMTPPILKRTDDRTQNVEDSHP
jgi:hypothetical protein